MTAALARCRGISHHQACSSFQVLKSASNMHMEFTHLENECYPGRREFLEAICAYDSKYYELAKHYYHKSYACGELAALHNLGVMHLHGQGIPKDHIEAIECFKLCASYNLAESMAQLGYMHLHGIGTLPSESKAIFWFQRSVASGNGATYFSKFHIASILINSGEPSETKRAVELLKECAENGHAPAIFNLALRAQVEAARQEAIQLLKQSAYRLGDAFSQNNLSVMRATGYEGGNGDHSSAMQLFTLAAEQHLSEAWFNLGVIHSRTEIIRDCILKSAKRFYKAATLGKNREAEFRLGLIFWHYEGLFVKNIDSLALYWFDRAAAKGHKAAMKYANELIENAKRNGKLKSIKNLIAPYASNSLDYDLEKLSLISKA